MAIIDSRSDSKFDALIRTNKADSLLAFIMATHKVKSKVNRRSEIAKRLVSSFELFRENIRGTDSGAGSYGQEHRNINEQFESQYTMGYEMGIWQDGDFTLNPLAEKVANYEITVSEYIGTVFLNLFTYYKIDNKQKFHHFLFEVLKSAKESGVIEGKISKDILNNTLPIEKKVEQGNILFNYLVGSCFFDQVDADNFALSSKWKGRSEDLINLCNLEYQYVDYEISQEMAKNKLLFSQYVTKSNLPNSRKDIELFDINRSKGGTNLLLYGVPGSGKSFKISKEYCDDESKMERVVFHPDYTYSDFVGQILPNVKSGNVSYAFTAGPFTRLLKVAHDNPHNMYFLVIEELNRGNAPAIFGEIFQLLDRDENGESMFGISNSDIASFIYNDSTKKIRILSNFSIIATMNTSDQNVFTLDTAFQRRWNMRMIENSFEDHDYANSNVLDTEVTWKNFCEVINNEILNKNILMTSSEDKRLGAYFVTSSDLKYYPEVNDLSISEKQRHEAKLKNFRFAEKVIKYLWDDAFKFSRDDIFKTSEFKSLEEVLNYFNSRNDSSVKGNSRFGIFKEEIVDALLKNPTSY